MRLNCRYFHLQKCIVAWWARKLYSYSCFQHPAISIVYLQEYFRKVSLFLILILAHFPLPFFGIFISIKHSILSTHIHHWNLMGSFAVRTVTESSIHTAVTTDMGKHLQHLFMSLCVYMPISCLDTFFMKLLVKIQLAFSKYQRSRPVITGFAIRYLKWSLQAFCF